MIWESKTANNPHCHSYWYAISAVCNIRIPQNIRLMFDPSHYLHLTGHWNPIRPLLGSGLNRDLPVNHVPLFIGHFVSCSPEASLRPRRIYRSLVNFHIRTSRLFKRQLYGRWGINQSDLYLDSYGCYSHNVHGFQR